MKYVNRTIWSTSDDQMYEISLKDTEIDELKDEISQLCKKNEEMSMNISSLEYKIKCMEIDFSQKKEVSYLSDTPTKKVMNEFYEDHSIYYEKIMNSKVDQFVISPPSSFKIGEEVNKFNYRDDNFSAQYSSNAKP